MKSSFSQFTEPRCAVFGRYDCNQCTAKSKRSGDRCRAPAVRGKSVCRMHGGKSTGPRTPEGKAALAARFLVHGTQTRRLRSLHREYMVEINQIFRRLKVKL
jgi:hypothetical protein